MFVGVKALPYKGAQNILSACPCVENLEWIALDVIMQCSFLEIYLLAARSSLLPWASHQLRLFVYPGVSVGSKLVR